MSTPSRNVSLTALRVLFFGGIATATLLGCNGILGIDGEIVVVSNGVDAAGALDDGGADAIAADGAANDDAGRDAFADEAAIDSAPDEGSIGCGGQLECARYVFVTAQTFTGRLDPPLGPDTKCQAAANATSGVLRGRTFLAWISTDSNAVNARLPHGTRPYRRVDGTTVAKDWNELTSGALAAPIDVTENGSVVEGTVWTGTAPNGSSVGAAGTCSDWSTATSSMGGVGGDCSLTDSGWTQVTMAGCSAALRLYCIEY